MKKLASLSLVLLIMPAFVFAVPITFTWDSLVQSIGTNPNPPGVSDGDPLRIVVTVDNGGSSTMNQTWNSSDFVSFSLSANNGAFTFFSDDQNLESTFRFFQTDISGTVINAPGVWGDEPIAEGTGSASLGTLDFWYLDGANNIISISSPNHEIGSNESSSIASNWVAAVPEPSTYALLSLLGLGFLLYRRRTAKTSA